VNDFEKQINYSLDKFTEANYLNENFFEDFGGYIHVSNWYAYALKEKEDIRGMQTKEMYAQKNYFGKKYEQYYSTL
jgi:hypothetical protein